MATPADALAALNLFQRDLAQLSLRRSQTDLNLLYLLDQPAGLTRLTFVRLQDRTVTAMAMFVATGASDGVLSFHVAFAVPEAYRNQGRAKDILRAALRQIEHGFPAVEVKAIRVEAIVGAENLAAQKVAAAAITPDPTPGTDEATGQPALRYGATLTRLAH